MTINWAKCKTSIVTGLDACCDKITASNPNIKPDDFLQWKAKVLALTDEKITNLKSYIKCHRTNRVLEQSDVGEYLKELHTKYVLVPIDKAANNIAIICKKFYVSVILKEIGIIGPGNETYERSDENSEEIIQNNLEYNERLHLKNNAKDNCLL